MNVFLPRELTLARVQLPDAPVYVMLCAGGQKSDMVLGGGATVRSGLESVQRTL